jgi:hypothetical protein
MSTEGQPVDTAAPRDKEADGLLLRHHRDEWVLNNPLGPNSTAFCHHDQDTNVKGPQARG